MFSHDSILLGWLPCDYSLKAHDEIDEDGRDEEMLCGDLSTRRALLWLFKTHLQNATSKVFPAFRRHRLEIDQQMLSDLFHAM
jgi:hypothetical protein